VLVSEIEKEPKRIHELRKMDLNVLEIDERKQIVIIFQIFNDFNIFEEFQIDKEKFLNFIFNLKVLYSKNGNPFHNFTHAFAGNQIL
jgi:hypothetical protein